MEVHGLAHYCLSQLGVQAYYGLVYAIFHVVQPVVQIPLGFMAALVVDLV